MPRRRRSAVAVPEFRPVKAKIAVVQKTWKGNKVQRVSVPRDLSNLAENLREAADIYADVYGVEATKIVADKGTGFLKMTLTVVDRKKFGEYHSRARTITDTYVSFVMHGYRAGGYPALRGKEDANMLYEMVALT